MPEPAGQLALKPDLCVIGGGAAGHAMALAATTIGLSCVVVDPRERLGIGQAADLATDILIAAAHGAAAAQRAAERESGPAQDRESYAALRLRIGRLVGNAAPTFGAERLSAAGVTVIRASAKFADPRTVTAGAASIQARRVVLATGARPALPTLNGLNLIRVHTPETLWGLVDLPPILAVLGRSPAAYEIAQAYRRLGSEVALIGGPEATQPLADPELLDMVERSLRRDGVALHLRRAVQHLEPRGAGVDITLDGAEPTLITATHLLIAGGMKPNADGLGLDRAGVRCKGGVPVVGPDLRTSNRRVFAIGHMLGGDVPGAAIPVQVGLVLRAAFFHQPVRYRPEQVPRAWRTAPALAIVGLDEATARRGARGLRVVRWPFAENDRAAATGRDGGHVKVVATPAGRVLGAAIVGAHADELIVPWTLAIVRRIPLGAVAALPVSTASLSDASRRAATAFVLGRLRGPWIKRVLRVLRLFG